MFKPADVVRLKSGGFKMMVSESTETHAKCIWHDNDGVLHEKLFSVDLLEVALDESGILRRSR
ncbi:DUF2158 domain-containing protein [Citrobacter freundii]|uniref:DUF2158 domain-containing protein n=1 Tax=Citrobacter freundii TaxID=546 RepID=UPI003AAE9F86